jgi:hypothetical protein
MNGGPELLKLTIQRGRFHFTAAATQLCLNSPDKWRKCVSQKRKVQRTFFWSAYKDKPFRELFTRQPELGYRAEADALFSAK